MGRATDLVQLNSTHPSDGTPPQPDPHAHLRSLRSAILTHLATALASAAEKVAQDAAGQDPFGTNDDLAKRTHALLKLLPDLLPVLPQPQEQEIDRIHPGAGPLIDEWEARMAKIPPCPFCGIPAEHEPDDCNANPDGLPARRARERLQKYPQP